MTLDPSDVTGHGNDGGAVWRFADRFSVVIYLVVLLIVFGLFAPKVLTLGSAVTIIQLGIPLLIFAIGMTFCLVCGEIDLSVGGIAGVASTVAALLMTNGADWWLAVGAALALGTLFGLVNGALTALLAPSFPKFPSFLVTLATLAATSGIALSLQPLQQAVAITDPTFRAAFGFGQFILLVSPVTWYAVAVAVLAHIALTRSRFGFAAYAAGTNARAASYVGYRVIRLKVYVLTVSGFLAAFAGILMAGFVQAGFASIAEGVEVDAIAAAVIGGASLAGGRGSIIGTLWGVAVIGVLNTGLLIAEAPTNVQMITKGILVVLALAVGEYLRRNVSAAR